VYQNQFDKLYSSALGEFFLVVKTNFLELFTSPYQFLLDWNLNLMLFGEETISEMLTGLEINTKAIDQHLQLTERTV
jgi:hypothetical protein